MRKNELENYFVAHKISRARVIERQDHFGIFSRVEIEVQVPAKHLEMVKATLFHHFAACLKVTISKLPWWACRIDSMQFKIES